MKFSQVNDKLMAEIKKCLESKGFVFKHQNEFNYVLANPKEHNLCYNLSNNEGIILYRGRSIFRWSITTKMDIEKGLINSELRFLNT